MREKVPRLAKLAVLINELFPELTAEMEDWSYTPDKAPRGARYRIDGVTHEGKRLVVHEKGRECYRPIFDHFPHEPYRWNYQVVNWIEQRLREQKRPIPAWPWKEEAKANG